MLNPKENLTLIGHQEAQDIFHKAFHSNRFHHAWIIHGPVGIGKATFAFHMARFLLSGEDNILSNNPIYRRILADSHGDLRVIGEEGEGEIGVETIRDLNTFLNQTSVEGGFRIVIIDGAERLNRNAANALLKRLEEPPAKTVFFLVTSCLGRLLPTIRSRCQVLTLSPLSESEVAAVFKSQDIDFEPHAMLAEGSPGLLARYRDEPGQQLSIEFQEVLGGKSATSLIRSYGGDEATYTLLEDLLRSHIHQELLEKALQESSLDKTLKIWDKVDQLLETCRFAQLDKKATLTCVFETLALRNK
jgi:DNA polymerase-3 subunit delta'